MIKVTRSCLIFCYWPSHTDLHKVLADDQLPGKVLFRLHQMPDRSIAWDDMIEDQRPDSAIFSHATNLADFGVN